MIRRSLFVLFFLGSGLTAFAQLGEIAVSFGNSKMRNNSLGTLTTTTGQTVELKTETNFRFGFRFTMNTYRFFGHEIGYAYNHGKLTGLGQDLGTSVHQGMYNFLVYALPEGSTIRPFATGGVHFSTFYPPGTGVFQGNGVTKFGFNYGGGTKVRITDIFLIRLDVRNYTTGKPDFGLANLTGLLQQLEVSAGLAFVF